ncbi:MAG: zinc ribbon domain-containing protein [Polyangiales bacterium]
MNQDPTATPQQAGDTFPCEKCGGALHWDATKRALNCPYCGHQQPMPLQPTAQIREIPIEEGFRSATRGLGVQVETITCKDCGATVNVGQGERTTKCAFCGSHQVLQVQTDANAIRPESLVAFQIDKKVANDRFASWIGDLWFRPNDLKKMAKVQEMGGVYVPFWTFDAHVHSDWTAEAGYHYYETEYYTDSEGNSQSRQVQRTRWESAWGRRDDDYDDTLVCASKGLPSELVDQFSTFNTKLLVPYAPHYLAGWRAEAYAVDLQNAHNIGRDKMAKQQEARCGRDVPGDTHRGLVVNNQFSRETFKHVLLPIWIAAYRYGDKPYRFLVNGQTGEVTGEAPYSFWKIFFFVLFILAIVGTVGYFIVQNQQEKAAKKKKAASDTEEEAPKKKTTPIKKKKKSSDDDGYLWPHSHERPEDGRFFGPGIVVSVPV